MPTSPGFFYGSLPPSLQQSYQYDPREQLAQQLLDQGTSQKPLRGGATEGVLRLANALLGGYNQRKLGQEYQQRGDQYNQGLASALSGVKAGHFATGADGKPSYVPTDISPLTQFSQNNPDATGLAQQLQVSGIESGLATDKTIQALKAKQLFDPPDWENPAYQDFELKKARASAEIYAPIRADALANQAANYSEDVRHNKAMEDIGRTNAENRPPPIVVGPDGSLHYAVGPVAGQEAPPKGMSLADKITLKQTPSDKPGSTAASYQEIYDAINSAKAAAGTVQGGVAGAVRRYGSESLSPDVQNYRLQLANVVTALTNASKKSNGIVIRNLPEFLAKIGPLAQVNSPEGFSHIRSIAPSVVTNYLDQLAARTKLEEGSAVQSPTVAPSSAPAAPQRIKFGDLPQ